MVEQLYLEDLEVKVIPVERSPPSLSSSWLSWAGTAVNLGPRLLRLNREDYDRVVEEGYSSRENIPPVSAMDFETTVINGNGN